MLERKGSQYRIRIINPKLFNKLTIRTKDVGKKGGLQFIIGRLKGKRKTTIQAIRVSINDFRKFRGKLRPVTKRGYAELMFLKRRKTGKLADHVKKYFSKV